MEEDPVLQSKLIGRQGKLQELLDAFEETLENGGTTVFISGEAGVGKTRLVEEFLEKAGERSDPKVIRGNCLPESMEPLMPIKESFREAGLQHLIAGDPPPKVISSYIMNESGMLLAKAEREESELDGDIFTSMLEAVESFVQDSLSEMGQKGEESSGLNTIGYDEYSILVRTGERFSLATIISGTKNEFLVDDMAEKLAEAEDNLESWDGDMSEAERVEPEASWFLETDRYQGEYLVEDPEIKQENLFDNVLLGLKRLSKQRPVILFIDDLQWADPSTLSLVHYLSRNTQDEPIFIMGTYRPEDILEDWEGKEHQFSRTMQNMSREGLYEEVELKRLSNEQSEEILDSIFEGIDVKDEFLNDIYEGSEGNPFFILETVKLLMDEGYIAQKESGWKVVDSIDSIHLPSKVHDVIVRRLNRLVEEQKRILSCGSMIGREFSSEVVGKALGLNRLDLLENLNKIEKTHRLIHSLQDRYEFDHSTIREVLIQDINEELKKEYHRVIADTYEGLYDDREEIIETLAHHYYEAGDEKAVDYLLKAGDVAREEYANEEAERFYKHTLDLARDEDDMRRAREGLGDIYSIEGEYDKALEHYQEIEDELIRLFRKKAEVYNKLGAYEESRGYIEQGLKAVSDPVEGNPVEKAKLLKVDIWNHLMEGDYDRADEECDRAISLLESTDDTRTLAESYVDRGVIQWYKNDMEEASEYYKDALEIFQDVEDRKQISRCYNNLGIVCRDTGRPDEAIEYYEKGLKIDKDIGDKYGIASILNNLGLAYKSKEELGRAEECYKESLKLREEINNREGIATSLNNLGNIYLRRGELDKAQEYHEESLELRREGGEKMGVAMSLLNLGEIYLAKDHIDEAASSYEEVLEIVDDTRSPEKVSATYVSLGNLNLVKGEIERATEFFKKGVEKAENNDLGEWAIVSKAGLAESFLKLEKVEKAMETVDGLPENIDEIADLETTGEVLRTLGMIYAADKDWPKAKDHFQRSIKIFEKKNMNLDLARTRLEYGKSLLCKGEREEGERYVNQARNFFEEAGAELWSGKCDEVLEDL